MTNFKPTNQKEKKIIIESYDEEDDFPSRAGEELRKKLEIYMEKNKINLCNNEILLIVDVIKK